MHAEQAHLVHLNQPEHGRRRVEWNAHDMEEFQSAINNGSCLYARLVSEPSTIDLMSYDASTGTWFSFYEHFFQHATSMQTVEQLH